MAKMKDGAILLNVGRGMIVDTDALCAALENGKLAGAVTHVFLNDTEEGYGVTAQNMLSNKKN